MSTSDGRLESGVSLPKGILGSAVGPNQGTGAGGKYRKGGTVEGWDETHGLFHQEASPQKAPTTQQQPQLQTSHAAEVPENNKPLPECQDKLIPA